MRAQGIGGETGEATTEQFDEYDRPEQPAYCYCASDDNERPRRIHPLHEEAAEIIIMLRKKE